jgi:hypothetical protein
MNYHEHKKGIYKLKKDVQEKLKKIDERRAVKEKLLELKKS